MLGTLHVIDATTRRDSLAQLALLRRDNDQVVSVGPPPQEALPPALPLGSVHCPMGSARLGGMVLQRVTLKTSLIHAWSPFAATAAAVAAEKQRLPLLLSLPHLPAPHVVRGLCKESVRDRYSLTVPTAHARGVLLAAGAREEAVHVLPPAAEGVDRSDAARLQARRAIGLQEQHVAVVPLGDMTRGGGYKAAVWTHALVAHLRPEVRLVLPGRGAGLSQLRRFAAASGFDHAVLMAPPDAPLADILPAADLATLLCDHEVALGDLAGALAAALPVVASRTPDILACTDGGQAARLVEDGSPQAAAAILLSLVEAPDLLADLSRRAQTTLKPRSSWPAAPPASIPAP